MLSDASSSTRGVPEIRRSCVSGSDRNTRRTVWAPAGVEIAVVSDCVDPSVNDSESRLPPELRPSAPALVAVVPWK